jgi:NADH-quinone oxidoreductase subunit L
MSVMMLAWLIPLFPLMSFILITLGGYRHPRSSHRVAIQGVVASLVIFIILFSLLVAQGEPFNSSVASINWMNIGLGHVRLGVYVDTIAVLLLFAVPTVCLLVFIYSIGYMHNDKSYSRFFAYVSLFAFAMLGLVICDNLLALFVFWEIMGICSYLLIGFWTEKPKAMAAALKAFFTTKVGDIFMLLGLLMLYNETGTLAYQDLFQPQVLQQLATTPLLPGMTVATVISLLIFAGTIGKSAQFPLHVWLPDAMEGPTPASALIHAATMVSGGIYLIIRIFPLLQISQALPYIALTGTFTALFASIIAVTQDDIKRVLAYSTISQLGYMVAAVGIGGEKASLFHLMTHAFFKALLFMAAGSVIHSVEHGYHVARGHAVPLDPSEGYNPNSMIEMGGVLTTMPVTAITYAVGGLALAGFPLVTAGFWSKDAILTQAWETNQQVFWGLAIAAGLTAFYITRQLCLVFLGTPRSEAASNTRENPNNMIIPLLFMALFAISVGWLGIPGEFPILGRFIPDVIEKLYAIPQFNTPAGMEANLIHESAGFAWIPVLVGVVVPACGLIVGWLLYGKSPLESGDVDPMEKFSRALRLRWLWKFIQNRFYIDEVYNFVFVHPLSSLMYVVTFVDRFVIDMVVVAIGKIGSLSTSGSQILDDTLLEPNLEVFQKISLTNISSWIDHYIIDEIINISGFISGIVSRVFHQFDERIIDGFIERVAQVTNALGLSVRKLQNGLITDYMWNAFLMVIVFITAVFLLQ